MNSKEYPEPKPDSTEEQSKVAEPVASYGYATSPSVVSKKPVDERRRIAGLEASDEVWQFAREHQLVPHLETTVRLAKESFQDIRAIYLTFEPDPEIPSLHGIAVNVRIASTLLEEWERQYLAFQKCFLQEIPLDVRSKICLFLWSA